MKFNQENVFIDLENIKNIKALKGKLKYLLNLKSNS